MRLRARAVSLAVRYTFTGASGATTVPMSRPSATMPSPAASVSAMICCCIATRRRRTSGTAATALTALDTSRVRMGPATSVPSTRIAGASGSVPTSITGWSQVPGHRVRVRDVHALVEQPPGERPVGGAGVQVAQPEGARDAPGRGRLAGSGRAVDGDHQA